ncbi:WD40 repeat domain-containing protein [Terricaulis sp.]|uniref:WD40 repeat domain-containing protein n=1 Tax=Terricaulis sp. TaxID=2768686 RepID=UPI0037850EE8
MTARVYEHGKRLALGAGATSVHWLGDAAYFALGDGALKLASAEGAGARHELHDGAILCAAPHPDGKRLLTGGDDGALKAVSETGEAETLLKTRGKWIDHVAANANSGVIVAGVGKEAIVFRNGAEAHRFTHATSVGGLALDAKGRRLATTHYGGATLRLVLAADDKGTSLNWAGSHLNVTLSPEGDYLVTAMQENELHGWRLPDKIDLRMSGYAAKTRSFSWDKRGRWLATSGADRAVLWPFVGKLGPQGKQPMLLGQREALVTAVAFHPSEDVLAIGYSDGVCVLARLSDEAVMDMDEAGEGAVTALAWNGVGNLLALGDEAGRGAIIQI